MNDVKHNVLLVTILRWVARIWSVASIALISFFIIAHVFGPEEGTFNSLSDVVQFLFFPSGIYLGMMIAWKWEGLGGSITTGSALALDVIRPDLILDAGIIALAAPGLLFLVCWLLSRGQQLETKAVD